MEQGKRNGDCLIHTSITGVKFKRQWCRRQDGGGGDLDQSAVVAQANIVGHIEALAPKTIMRL